MAVTAKQVFDMAMVLIDEVQETGNIIPDQPEYYKAKALSLLTTLQTELLPLHKTPVIIADLADKLQVSDRIALTALPYGLAAHLLMTDDINTASFLNDRYEELKRKAPISIQSIQDVNDVLGGML